MRIFNVYFVPFPTGIAGDGFTLSGIDNTKQFHLPTVVMVNDTIYEVTPIQKMHMAKVSTRSFG